MSAANVKARSAGRSHKKPASETPWTRKLWIYDLRTNKHFTLRTNPLKRADLDEFVALFNTANRHQRQATWSAEQPDGRWRVYEYDDLVARDKASLDIFWLKDESLADNDNLPPPEVIAQEIVDDLEAALGLGEADVTDTVRWARGGAHGAVAAEPAAPHAAAGPRGSKPAARKKTTRIR